MWRDKDNSSSKFECSSLADVGARGAIIDDRDGSAYPIAKLLDGKCWMTQNLRISNITLTPADSDVESNFYLPASSTDGFHSNDYTSVYVDIDYGGRYTWYAATAGEGTSSKTSGDTTHSICPKGWRLPTLVEYTTLVNLYGGNNSTGNEALRKTPVPAFVYGGSLLDKFASSIGSSGFYWSSTAYDDNNAYALMLSGSTANSANVNFKRFGFSVRCVSRQ